MLIAATRPEFYFLSLLFFCQCLQNFPFFKTKICFYIIKISISSRDAYQRFHNGKGLEDDLKFIHYIVCIENADMIESLTHCMSQAISKINF